MHISSSILALALGLAPTWAVPMKELSARDIYPGTIPIERFREIEQDLPVLKPRLPTRGDKDPIDFTLKKDIVLNWDNGEEHIIRAQLTAKWQEEEEVTVINMADFAAALENVECTAPIMVLTFKHNNLAYHDAQEKWEWIYGGEGNNNIIMFANHPSCDDVGKSGAPFRVTSINYFDDEFTAHMVVEEIANLESVIPDGELVIETIADIDEPIEQAPRDEDDPVDSQEPGNEVSKRLAVSIAPSISLQKDFNNKNILTLASQSGADYIKLDCTTCGSRGKIDIKLYTRIRWFEVQESYIEFTARDVQAFINLKLHGKAAQTKKGHKVLIPITGLGFQIPHVATLRLGADFGVGYEAGLLGEGEVTWGATAMLTNPSVLRQCFRGCNNNNVGWQITTQQVQPAASGSLMAILGAHMFITPKAEVRIFNSGYEVGVALLAPKFEGTALVQANSAGGICANPRAILGVGVDLQVGLQCYVYAGPSYQSPDWQLDIFERMWPLYNQCFVLATL